MIDSTLELLEEHILVHDLQHAKLSILYSKVFRIIAQNIICQIEKEISSYENALFGRIE